MELRALLNATRITPTEAGQSLAGVSGVYAFFVDTPDSLPAPYAQCVRRWGATLIYIGKASNSLCRRAFEQDLRHRSPASFFRSIGAVLGYTPVPGSLAGRKNQRNYRFSPDDTARIIAWIDAHLTVAALPLPAEGIEAIEKALILAAKPLLNLLHNPQALSELKAARDRCGAIARGMQDLSPKPTCGELCIAAAKKSVARLPALNGRRAHRAFRVQ